MLRDGSHDVQRQVLPAIRGVGISPDTDGMHLIGAAFMVRRRQLVPLNMARFARENLVRAAALSCRSEKAIPERRTTTHIQTRTPLLGWKALDK